MTNPPENPQQPESGTSGRMPPAAWFAIGLVAVLVAVGVPLFLLGGDDDIEATTTTAATSTTVPADTSTTAAPTTTTEPAETTTTVPATTTTTEATTTTTIPDVAPAMAPRVYFLAMTEGSNLDGPHLAAVARAGIEPGDAADTLSQVIQALLDGPQGDDPSLAELSSAVPEDVELLGVSVADGIADIDLSGAFGSGGGSFSVISRLAQLVFTATQFPDVEAVVLRLDGELVEEFSSEGYLIEGPLTRDEFYDNVLPLVFLDDPAAGTTVGSSFAITGIANAFEATVLYEVTLDGDVLTDGFTTATCGTGCWGDFTVDVDLPADASGDALVTVFEESAEDGRRINIQSYPVTLTGAG